MKVIVLGTNHDIQEKDYKGTNEFRAVLEYIIRVWQIELVMEEWTSTKGSTAGHRLASDLNIQWFNVGTPSIEEFKTDIPLLRPHGRTTHSNRPIGSAICAHQAGRIHGHRNPEGHDWEKLRVVYRRSCTSTVDEREAVEFRVRG